MHPINRLSMNMENMRGFIKRIKITKTFDNGHNKRPNSKLQSKGVSILLRGLVMRQPAGFSSETKTQ